MHQGKIVDQSFVEFHGDMSTCITSDLFFSIQNCRYECPFKSSVFHYRSPGPKKQEDVPVTTKTPASKEKQLQKQKHDELEAPKPEEDNLQSLLSATSFKEQEVGLHEKLLGF